MSYPRTVFNNFYLILFILTVCVAAVTSLAQPQRSGHVFSAEMLGNGRLLPAKWTAGCGIDSLYAGLALIGVDVDYIDLMQRAKLEKPKQWVSLNTLWQVTREVGAHALPVRIKTTRETDLSSVLKESGLRTAILHLQADKDQPEHMVCAYLTRKGDIAIAGEQSYQVDVGMTWRKRWSGIALLLSQRPILKNVPTNQPVPRIHLEHASIEGGKIPNGGHFDYTVEIRNTGEGILHIEEVLPSCACTTPGLSKDSLAPGDTARLTGSVKVGNRTGPGTAEIYIKSDDPERPVAGVMIKWEVEPPLIEFDPLSVTIPQIVQGGSGSAQVRLNFIDKELVAIEKISSPERWIDCALEPGGQALKISVSPTWSSGKRVATVFVTLNSGNSKLALPVSVEVVPAVVVTPTQLFCGRKNSEKYVTKEIELRPAEDGASFSVLEAELDSVPGTVIVHKSLQDANYWNLEVTLGPFESSDTFVAGHILVKTSHDIAKEVKIPVFVK